MVPGAFRAKKPLNHLNIDMKSDAIIALILQMMKPYPHLYSE